MIPRRRVQAIFSLLSLTACLLGACATSVPGQGKQVPLETQTSYIPTWTPLPLTQVQEGSAETATPTATERVKVIRTATPTAATVLITVLNGDMNIRRGPGVDYNPIGVMSQGQSAVAVGRDRVRRWLFVEIPSGEVPSGWVSALTEFTEVTGDVDQLPVVTVEPANPAFIRNCTKHTLWVLPVQVQLLPKVNEPYNEERFPPGEYLVFDLDVSDDDVIQEVNLREGLVVEILYDGNNEKSKCE
jgi:hypothetical protein